MWNRASLWSCTAVSAATYHNRMPAASLRRPRSLTQSATLPMPSMTLALASRCLSTEETVDAEAQWGREMTDKYGVGNYQLFRPLYKDLCDEIRREYYTKPPPPLKATSTRWKRPNPAAAAAAAPTAEATAQNEKSEEPAEQADASAPSPPAVEYGDGSWSVQYLPEHNTVTFHRAAVQEGRLAAVHAWSRIELKDPPRLNAVLTFADWIPIEVCVERNGVLIHFSMASNEGGMHMRNVRVYAPKTAEERTALLDPSDDGEYARKKLYYDGPCLWHLELDFQNELYDVMQDHGVTLDWVHWAASWVFYLEHVNYVKWNVGMLEELIPSPLRGPEDDFLLPAEKAMLDEPVEDWLDAHSI